MMKRLKPFLVVLGVLSSVVGVAFLSWWLQREVAEEVIAEDDPVAVESRSEESVIDEELVGLLETSDLSDITVREKLAEQVRAQEEAIQTATHARAERLGIPIREEWEDGRIVEIQGFDGDEPIYFSSFNGGEYRVADSFKAAYASLADEIRNVSPYNVSGKGVTVGVWDGGKAYNKHPALGTKGVVIMDKAKDFSNHATLVTGTITADGTRSPGMAPSSLVRSYDWNFDISEMLLAGAGSSGEVDRISVSNHSYGQLAGYEPRGRGFFNWYGPLISDFEPEAPAVTSDGKFGRYSDRTRVVDTVAYSLPYLTSFFAAANDRNQNPKGGEMVTSVISQGSFEVGRRDYDAAGSFKYDEAKSPKGDGKWRDGFENIRGAAVAKNNIVVGAVAVTGDRLGATMSEFSSWGPTDDGRIKPDIVALGVDVNSTALTGHGYAKNSGTSLASPLAAGSAALLVELYQDKFHGLMRSSMMKGLLIHTADDVGRPGPDYTFGWGLINVKKAADIIIAHKKFYMTDPTAGPKMIKGSILANKEPFTFVFQSDGTKPIRATLCWTDPAGRVQEGTDSRKSALSHNLDLLITGPNGELHRPFKMPYVGDWSKAKLTANATRGKNDTDNVEQIFDKAKPTLNGAGIYKVTVSLDGSLKRGITKQDFSLVVTGGKALPKGEAVIDLDDSLNFGKVADGRSRTLHLNIRNLGDDDLLVSGIDFGGNMDLSGNFDGLVKPGEVGVAPITYTPISYMPSAVAANVKWFGTLKVLCTSKAGRITVPLARSVAGKSNDAPRLKLPEPGVNLKTNYIDNIVGSEWSYDLVPNDWSEEKAVPFSNRFAFNKDWTVRIIVVDNPNYRTSDIKAGFEWMPIGPNQVKLYNPNGFPGYQEGIILKFTSEKVFETTNLVGQAIIGRRYGEPGPKVDFTKDLSGMVMHYTHHFQKGNTTKDFSTEYDGVVAVLQAGGGMKAFIRDDTHGLWDNVTWKPYGDNVVSLYNDSTRQEMYLHLVSPKFTGYKGYVTVGWTGNNVEGSITKAWKDPGQVTDLTKRNEREITGHFGGIGMEWRLPDQDADEARGHWLAIHKTTQKQWKSVMGTNPSKRTGDNLPVQQVTSNNVRDWIKKMKVKYPLPKGTTWSTLPKCDSTKYPDPVGSGFKAIIVAERW